MTDEAVAVDGAVDQAAEDAAFSAGFASVHDDGKPPPVEPVKAEPEKVEPQEVKEAAPAQAEPAKQEPEFTPAQLAALAARVAEIDTLKGSLDKMSGHVGTLLQEVRTLKTPAKQEKAAPELPQVDEEEFVSAYGPEVAAYVRQQIAKMGSGAPPELVERLNAAEAQNYQLAAALEERTIAILHSDWADVLNSDGYKGWLATQPENVRQVAQTTPDAMQLAQVITLYKGSAKKQQTTNRNKERLEAAIVPEGIPAARPAEMTEEDAMRAGFAAIAGRK